MSFKRKVTAPFRVVGKITKGLAKVVVFVPVLILGLIVYMCVSIPAGLYDMADGTDDGEKFSDSILSRKTL